MLAVVFVAESWPAPVPVRRLYEASYGHGRTEPVPPRPSDHPLARAIAALPADAVLVDMPFGAVPDELWWQYLSIGHWRRRLNGYSGDVPPGHLALQQTLTDLPAALEGGATAGTLPDAAMEAIRTRGATHVLLHQDSWPSAQAPDALRGWLRPPRRHARRPGRRHRNLAAPTLTRTEATRLPRLPPCRARSVARFLPSSSSFLLLVLPPSSVLSPPSSPVCPHGTLMAHVRVR